LCPEIFDICSNADVVAVLRIRYVYPGSRILIFTHPGFRISDPGSRIPDSKTAMKIRSEKKIIVILFFGAINFIKLYYFMFEMLKKNIWANFHRIIELFIQKIVTKLSKIWVWDPGVQKAPDPGSGSATRCGGRPFGRVPYCT
jgi:hypothetical protein